MRAISSLAGLVRRGAHRHSSPCLVGRARGQLLQRHAKRKRARGSGGAVVLEAHVEPVDAHLHVVDNAE